MATRPAFRFAPSPNGHLHLGHAYSALVGYELAQKYGARFLVRIEDIDIHRSRPEFVAAILQDLTWLGITWEEPVLHQSTNFHAYQRAASQLRDAGLIYPCFATRAEIAAKADPALRDPDGAPLYPGISKGMSSDEIRERLARGEQAAWRLDMDAALCELAAWGTGSLSFCTMDENGARSRCPTHPERWGDAVIVRKDVPASYHLSVVVDDAAQGITHVTRGSDLLPSTDLHRLLQVLLGLPEPVYFHHRLITDESGRKLSKSLGDTALRTLRSAGATPADIRRMVGLSG